MEFAPLPDLPERVLVLMVGVPGSGKSSFLAHHRCPSISTDALREMLWGDTNDQRAPAQVFTMLRTIVAARLEAVTHTFIDATNLNARDRRPLMRMAAEAGQDTYAIWMDTDVDECLRRNRRRTRQVGEDVVLRMARTLRTPTASEGIAHLYRVRCSAGEWVY